MSHIPSIVTCDALISLDIGVMSHIPSAVTCGFSMWTVAGSLVASRLDRGPERAKDDGGFVAEPDAVSMSGNGMDGQLRLGLRSFLVRPRRGSVVGGLHSCHAGLLPFDLDIGVEKSLGSLPSIDLDEAYI